MEIDAELRRQVVVSMLAAAAFVAGLVGIGVVYDGARGFSESGAIALIGLLTGFILLMALVGTYLIRVNDADETDE